MVRARFFGTPFGTSVCVRTLAIRQVAIQIAGGIARFAGLLTTARTTDADLVVFTGFRRAPESAAVFVRALALHLAAEWIADAGAGLAGIPANTGPLGTGPVVAAVFGRTPVVAAVGVGARAGNQVPGRITNHVADTALAVAGFRIVTAQNIASTNGKHQKGYYNSMT
jgi:hypothetical protein